jgi:hypothetical protein
VLLAALVGCKTSTSDPPQPASVRDAEPAPTASTTTPTRPRSSRPAEARPDEGSYAAEPKTWCLAREGDGVSDRVVPPFTMSAGAAMRLTYQTKHVHELYRHYRALYIDADTFECARVCAPRTRDCGFHFRLIDTTSGWDRPKEVEWVYVDPFERKLWFPAEGGWSSEDLAERD